MKLQSNLYLYSSFQSGLTALHIAAFYGQTEFCRDMFAEVPANIISEKPNDNQKLGDIKLEVSLFSVDFVQIYFKSEKQI